MKYTKYNDQYVFPINGQQPVMTLNSNRLGLFTTPPADGEEIDIDELIPKINALEKELNSQLIRMEAPIHLCINGLLSSNNVFLYSKPGAAKTTLAGKFGEAIGNYFKINFTPETTKNDIFGPVSINGVKEGKWIREWSGIAGAHIVLVDEFFKGSSAIRNALLDVCEERKVSDAEGSKSIPILLLIAASNEIIDPNESNAMWDRFGLRGEVKYPSRANDLENLFSSATGRLPIQTKLDPDELLLLQGIVELRAKNLSKSLIEPMIKVLQNLTKNDINNSPRRSLAWSRSIVAEAMLAQEEVNLNHIEIGANILWIDPKDKNKVSETVMSVSNPERMFVLHTRRDLEELSELVKKNNNRNEMVNYSVSIKKIIKAIDKQKGKIDPIELSEITEIATNLLHDTLMKATDLVAPVN